MNEQILYTLIAVLVCTFGLGIITATPKLKQIYSDLLSLQRKFAELSLKYDSKKKELKTLRKARKKR